MRRTALLIVHRETSDPGRVGRLLSQGGYDLDIRCPNLGHALPENMAGHDAAVIFGGPMSVNDGHDMPGIGAELAFMPKILESDKPFLGICLGAQLLARTLGADVWPHPKALAEIGYYRVIPTKAGEAYFDGPTMFYEWHREGFDLPASATLLATGETFTNQAFRYGDNALGIQFHPEVTREMMGRWTASGAERLKSPGAQPAEAHFTGMERHDAAVDRWIRRAINRLFGTSLPLAAEQFPPVPRAPAEPGAPVA